MQIGILGTGRMAAAMAEAWARGGHDVAVGRRSDERARALAAEIDGAVRAGSPREVVAGADAVLLAVAWDGLEDVLALAGAPDGSLAGTPVLECTNPVDLVTRLLLPPSGSAAERVASIATGSHVVKALHLFAGTSWLAGADERQPVRSIAMCGDHPEALATAARLVEDLGTVPVVVGDLGAARQLEEAAGFVMRLVGAGCNPVTAVPFVDVAASSR